MPQTLSSRATTSSALTASQTGVSWIIGGGIASALYLILFSSGENHAYAEEEQAEENEEEQYRKQLAAIEQVLESVMKIAFGMTSMADMAEQLWQKISVRDASGIASMLNSNAQLDGAIVQLLAMLESGRDRRELCKPLAVAYILRGQFEQAMPFLIEANWDNPRDADLYLHRGHIHMRQSSYADAFEAFEKALLLNPELEIAKGPRNEMMKKMALTETSELYWHIQGVVRYDLGMYLESYKCYNKALEINPKYADSWYNAMVVKHLLDQKALYERHHLEPIPTKLLPIVSTYEYATMAEAVYTSSAYAFPPKDWNLLMTSSDFLDHNGSLSRDGFYGAVYVNHTKKQVVLALQGTKSTQDLISCAHLAFNAIDRQWICAKVFGEKVHEKIREDASLKDYRISFTGHSLGAAQAELLAFLHGETAVTFESPGIRTLLNSISQFFPDKPIDDPSSFRITGYMPQPNLINTGKEHVGSLIRIYPPLPKQIRGTDNAQVILENMEAFRRLNEIISVPGLDKLVASPFGTEVIKLLGETELIVLETLHWHSMSRICQVFRHEYETGIPIKQRVITKWPTLDRYYLYWRVAKDCFGEPDEAVVSELNREALRFSNYEVQDRPLGQIPLNEFTKREQSFLREYRRNPALFARSCTELDKRILAKYIIDSGSVEPNVGLSPEHFKEYIRWKAEQSKSVLENIVLSISSLF